MSLSEFLHRRRTWIGIAAFPFLCVLFNALGALLIVRGIVPVTAEQGWVWGSAGLAAFCAGLLLLPGRAILPMAAVTWGIWMLLLAGTGFLLPGELLPGKQILITALALLAGLILAACLRREGRKSHPHPGRRRKTKGRSRR